MPLEVNIVLVGFKGDGGYRYILEPSRLEEILKIGFPTHRPSCLETGEPIDIEHHLIYNVISVSGIVDYLQCLDLLRFDLSNSFFRISLLISITFYHWNLCFWGWIFYCMC